MCLLKITDSSHLRFCFIGKYPFCDVKGVSCIARIEGKIPYILVNLDMYTLKYITSFRPHISLTCSLYTNYKIYKIIQFSIFLQLWSASLTHYCYISNAITNLFILLMFITSFIACVVCLAIIKRKIVLVRNTIKNKGTIFFKDLRYSHTNINSRCSVGRVMVS